MGENNPDFDHGTITNMTPGHAEAVSRAHNAAFPNEVLPKLGHAFLSNLYKAILESESAFGVVCIVEGEVGGFVLANTDVENMYKRVLRGHWPKLIGPLITQLVKSPNLIPVVFETLFYGYRKDPRDTIKAEWMVWGVNPKYRGRNIGKRLVMKMNEMYKERGVSVYKLIVYDSNDHVNSIYTSWGFKFLYKTKLYKKEANIYKIDLTDNKIS